MVDGRSYLFSQFSLISTVKPVNVRSHTIHPADTSSWVVKVFLICIRIGHVDCTITYMKENQSDSPYLAFMWTFKGSKQIYSIKLLHAFSVADQTIIHGNMHQQKFIWKSHWTLYINIQANNNTSCVDITKKQRSRRRQWRMRRMIARTKLYSLSCRDAPLGIGICSSVVASTFTCRPGGH